MAHYGHTHYSPRLLIAQVESLPGKTPQEKANLQQARAREGWGRGEGGGGRGEGEGEGGGAGGGGAGGRGRGRGGGREGKGGVSAGGWVGVALRWQRIQPARPPGSGPKPAHAHAGTQVSLGTGGVVRLSARPRATHAPCAAAELQQGRRPSPNPNPHPSPSPSPHPHTLTLSCQGRRAPGQAARAAAARVPLGAGSR
jgi:hypothetical protein